MNIFHIIFILSPLLCSMVQGARILVFLPLETWSHYMQYELVYETLATRGHHITMYSPYPPKQNITNFQHIYITSQAFLKMMEEFDVWRDCKDTNWFFLDTIHTRTLAQQLNQEILESLTFRELITSKQSFDLVMIEPFFHQECTVLLGHVFKAPVINMGAVPPQAAMLDAMHSPNLPSFMPEIYSSLTAEMTFLERIQNWHYTVVRFLDRLVRNWLLDRMIEEQLGPGYPPLDSMVKNISFCFLYGSPALEYAKPLTPNMAEVGGIHIQRINTLNIPEDFKKTLDEATDGLILFSFGTVISPKTLSPHLKKTLLTVFSKLRKYKILWKWSGEPLPGLPPNVIQQKWIPQMAVLAHPNCKLFITHGGLSSQLETVYQGVPVVTIPFFGDQFSNAAKAVDYGFGVVLKNTNLTTESLEWAITTVIQDPSYKERAMLRSRLIKDYASSPLDTAVYWTEYVLQHGGASHLTPASKQLNWYQYYLLDVLAFILGLLILMWVILSAIVKTFIRKFSSNSSPSNKDLKIKKNR
uniref:UDP-glucuronosyltransferase n=1 Tax=Cacopsylla melanoneura TaxID=428564 RepID=A0A8D8X770_9HEMI